MSDEKRRESRILRNVTNKAVNLNNSKLLEENGYSYNASSNYDRRCSSKENKFSVDINMVGHEHKAKGRLTASTLVFGEEPVFSDSDEETEYHRNIFETQDMEIVSIGTPKMVNVAVQCNIISNEMVLKDLIKECAKFNIEDVTEEFKLVILHCKRLQTVYGNDISPLCLRSVSIEDVSEIQLYQDEQNMMSSHSPSISTDFLPTKQRGSNNGFSESIDSGITVKLGEESSSSKNDVIDQLPKPANNGKGKGKTISYKTVNTKKYETRLKKPNGNHKTLDAKKDPVTNSNNERKLRKRPNSESIATSSTKRVKNEKHEGVEKISLKTNVKRSRKGSRKLAPLTLEYITERVKDQSFSILLPKRQTRAMGKNWINFKRLIKAREIPVPLKNCNHRPSQEGTHRVRRLYSPTEWLLSKEFSTLVEEEIKCSSDRPNIH